MVYSSEDLAQLVVGFETATLPAQEWTHEKHLAMAMWYLHHYDVEDATIRIRSGIIHYNLAQGNQNTVQSGYHETITLFWIDLIKHYLHQHPGVLSDVLQGFLNSSWSDKNILFNYYTQEFLFSPRARARWVPPDLLTPDWQK